MGQLVHFPPRPFRRPFQSGLLPLRLFSSRPLGDQDLAEFGDGLYRRVDGGAFWLGFRTDSRLSWPLEPPFVNIEEAFIVAESHYGQADCGYFLTASGWSRELDGSSLYNGMIALSKNIVGFSRQDGESAFEVYTNGQSWASSAPLAELFAPLLLAQIKSQPLERLE